MFGMDFVKNQRVLNPQKERLTKDVRYQDRSEIALDYADCKKQVVKGYFIFVCFLSPAGRFFIDVSLKVLYTVRIL